ncbi:MAG: carbohydrate binding domain-containing protein, partial [Thermoplasmata archaeon]
FLLLVTVFRKEKQELFRFGVKRERVRTLTAVALTVLVLVDLSTFVSPKVQGWKPIGSLESGEGIYLFPQTGQVPPSSGVYQHIAEDGGDFRILSVPVAYSLPYYQYLRYLSGTRVTMTHGYGLTVPTGLQGEVYESVRRGNITEDLGEKMALIGGKYVIYDFKYGKWPALLQRMNSSVDLQFVMEDEGYFLYRNKRFGDSHISGNLIGNGGFEDGEDGWFPWERENGTTELDSTVTRSGKRSLKAVSTGLDDLAGRVFVIDSSVLNSTEFTLSGWSRCENVSGENPLYAIRANTIYSGEDGEIVSAGSYAFFSVGTHEWEFSSTTFSVNTTMEIESIRVSIFLRNATGTAWFDDIYLNGERLVESWGGAFW